MARDSESDDKDDDAEHVEPADVGGADWLLQQLGGGRESRTADAPSDAVEKRGDEPDDVAPPTIASPKLRWSWATGTAEPIEQPLEPNEQPVEPIKPAVAEPAGPATFNWALTPTDDVDPLVAQPASQATPTPASAPQPSESDVADENDYFHPALPIPGTEPRVPAETTEIPVAAAESTEIPFVAADTTPFPVAAAETTQAPIDAAEPLDETPTAASAGARRSMPTAASSSGNSGGPSKRTTRILFWVAGGLLVVLVLIGLYVFGTQIPGFVSAAPTPTPTATKTATPTPTPTPTAQATGPQTPGVHAWDTLRGGECLNPFSSPWALKFTVVDCANPHSAQLVYTNVFTSDAAAAFPGDAQLASQINLLCTKPGIINLDAAGAFTDAQIQGSYPATEKQWKAGQRSYFCFVNRAGGEPLTGSIAGPGPAS